MQSKLSTIEDTGLNRFIVFLESLADIFVENKHFFLFFSHFNKIYQAETIGETSDNYQKIFKKSDFGSKDTVKFLTEKFYDGSIKPSLSDKETAVALTYSALYFCIGLAENEAFLPTKYGIDVLSNIRIVHKSLIDGIKA